MPMNILKEKVKTAPMMRLSILLAARGDRAQLIAVRATIFTELSKSKGLRNRNIMQFQLYNKSDT